jgi:hypothetical protein
MNISIKNGGGGRINVDDGKIYAEHVNKEIEKNEHRKKGGETQN